MGDLVEKEVPQLDHPAIGDHHEGERGHLPAPGLRIMTGTLGVGMVGYSFMGAAHSQAWRTAGRFFDLPLTPDMAVLCGRDAAAAQAAAAAAGLAIGRDRLEGARPPRRRRPGRRLHPRRHARRDRDRRAGGGQARAVREAARQHRRRGARDGRGGRAGRGQGRALDGGVQLPPGAGARAGAPARRRGPDRRDPARPRRVPAGLDRRSRSSRWSGGCRRTRRAPARWATSARTSSTLRSS